MTRVPKHLLLAVYITRHPGTAQTHRASTVIVLPWRTQRHTPPTRCAGQTASCVAFHPTCAASAMIVFIPPLSEPRVRARRDLRTGRRAQEAGPPNPSAQLSNGPYRAAKLNGSSAQSRLPPLLRPGAGAWLRQTSYADENPSTLFAQTLRLGRVSSTQTTPGQPQCRDRRSGPAALCANANLKSGECVSFCRDFPQHSPRDPRNEVGPEIRLPFQASLSVRCSNDPRVVRPLPDYLGII